MLAQPAGLPEHIVRSLAVLESLNEQISSADAELAEIAKDDDCARRLMSVPGVGPVTAMRFLAAIDDAKRFNDGAHLASYLGLSPGENTTGFRTKRTRLTKAGPPEVRWALGQAAWNFYRRRPNDPIVRWAKCVAERRGVQIAIVALARKVALILYAIWRDGTTYEPKRGQGVAASPTVTPLPLRLGKISEDCPSAMTAN
jgi:transposase